MVYIKEVFPNPAGDDTSGEWIKIINTGSSDTPLGGWSISDASGKNFVFREGISISPNNELILPYQETKLTLNNNGDTITLKNAEGQIVDTLAYSKAVESDELIIAERFMPSAETSSAHGTSLNDLSFSGEGAIMGSSNGAPILVAIVFAIVAGIVVGLISKRLNEK